ncbi:Rieske (2Fe-2S) protein [Plastoroseomonas arctica]|nr:Rieske (2Fe-2S) protein [Plastoroseomonas arctica]
MTSTTPEATAADPALHLAATYRREVGASVDRIFENVFDWEHLPALHDSYFTAVERLDSGDWGWRIRLSRPPSTPDREQVLRLEVDRARHRYTAIFEEGIGAGTRFWTLMTPLDAHRTAVEVRYYLPEMRPEKLAVLGGKYMASCERLWSEDEAMMQHREMAEARARAWAAAPRPKPEPVELGPVAALLPRLPLVVAFAERPFRVVALEDGALVAHSTICPHWLGPLEDAPVEDGCAIRCPWHGWRFDARTGASLDGHRARLAPAPRVAVAADGMVTLVPADG